MAKGGEAKVRLRLDTGLAQKSLKQLQKTAGTVSGQVTGGIRKAFGGFGIGAGIAAGAGAVTGAARSGIGNIVGNYMGGAYATISSVGGLSQNAKAGQIARDQLFERKKHIGHRTGITTADVQGTFKTDLIRARRQLEVRKQIETDPRLRGTGAKALMQELLDKIDKNTEAVKAAAEKLRKSGGR
jgi:hypothetical protein